MTSDKKLVRVKENEIRALTTKVDGLIDKENVYMQIATRGADPESLSLINFRVFDDKKLATIAEKMPEINRATAVFGKKNSQVTGQLMTLAMISQSPYRRLRQCLAQIERKRGAVKENIFKLRRERVELERNLLLRETLITQLKNDDLEVTTRMTMELDVESLNIDIEEKAANISDSVLYIEGAFKEIGMYQNAYGEIKESFDIPEKWDEEDFEKMEVEEHVKTAFLHAIRDVSAHGALGMGTLEYLEQYGINPVTAFDLVTQYLHATRNAAGVQGQYPDINSLYSFLDKSYEMFGKEYKKAMDRVGLKNLIKDEFVYKEDKEELDLLEEGAEE